MHHAQASRRAFLKHSAALTALGGSPFAVNLLTMGAAAAQSATDHKALVCVFLFGGNDQSNTVLPASGSSAFGPYATARGPLTLPLADQLALSPTLYDGPPLALHRALAPIKPLFDASRLAVVANVGTLTQPLTRQQWNDANPSVPVPYQLFSHSDQQGGWQTGRYDGPGATGWFGRLGDLLTASHNASSGLSMTLSIGGNAVMLAGNQTIQYQLYDSGAVKVWGLDWLYGSGVATTALRRLLTDARPQLLENELVKIQARAISTESLVNGALKNVTLNTVFPGSGLGRQLKMAARMIAARQALGQRRQLFFVQGGGFDFHDNLLNDQQARLADVAASMAAFQAAMDELGTAQQVTAFTASEFGRALQSNGRGSDHGWGGHQFVMGGAVRGRRIVGDWPTVALNGPEDAGQGRLIPTMAVDEFNATLAKWFGVADSDLPLVIPNIGRFARRDVGLFA